MMRQSCLLFLLAVCAVSPGFTTGQDSVTIEVNHLRNNNGFVLLSLYCGNKGYPDDPAKALRNEKVPIRGKSAVFIFHDLPPGAYAVAVLHDENGNMKMDKRFGIPREGYGFSNNVMGFFGPPGFNKASFKVADHKTINITMRY